MEEKHRLTGCKRIGQAMEEETARKTFGRQAKDSKSEHPPIKQRKKSKDNRRFPIGQQTLETQNRRRRATSQDRKGKMQMNDF